MSVQPLPGSWARYSVRRNLLQWGKQLTTLQVEPQSNGLSDLGVWASYVAPCNVKLVRQDDDVWSAEEFRVRLFFSDKSEHQKTVLQSYVRQFFWLGGEIRRQNMLLYWSHDSMTER